MRSRSLKCGLVVVSFLLGGLSLIHLSEATTNGPMVVGLFWTALLFALAFFLVRALAQLLSQPPGDRHRILKAVVLLCLGLPLAMQIQLGISVSFLGVFWPFLLSVIVIGLVCALAVTALFLAIAAWRKRAVSLAAVLFGANLYLAIITPLSAFLGAALWVSQQSVNDRDGTRIGLAVHQLHAERGTYPETLGELKPQYLKSIPWWWHGFIKRPYIYWVDPRANLKYCSEPWSGRFFSFGELKWHTSTL